MPQVPSDSSLKIFSDLWPRTAESSGRERFFEKEILIVDHHVSQPCPTEYQQVNCLPYGHTRMSAAGICYLIGKTA